MWQSAGYATHDMDDLTQLQCPAGHNGAYDGDKRAGDFLRDAFGAHGYQYHSTGDCQGMHIDLFDLLQIGPDLGDRAVAATRKAEHSRDLSEGDLGTDAREKADQHRAGQEIGHEPQAYQSRHDQECGGHEGQHCSQGHILVRTGRREAHQARGQNRRCRRIRPHYQVPGGTEQGEQHHGHQHGVQTGDHRRTRDLRITHHLGDRQRRQGDTGHEFGRDLRPLDRQYPLQELALINVSVWHW